MPLPVLTVRIPVELQKKLKARAKREKKTLSGLAIELLTAAIDEPVEGKSAGQQKADDSQVVELLQLLRSDTYAKNQALLNLLLDVIAATLATRHYASLGAEFGDEMSVFIQEGRKLTAKEREARARERESNVKQMESELLSLILAGSQEPGGEEEGS